MIVNGVATTNVDMYSRLAELGETVSERTGNSVARITLDAPGNPGFTKYVYSSWSANERELVVAANAFEDLSAAEIEALAIRAFTNMGLRSAYRNLRPSYGMYAQTGTGVCVLAPLLTLDDPARVALTVGVSVGGVVVATGIHVARANLTRRAERRLDAAALDAGASPEALISAVEKDAALNWFDRGPALQQSRSWTVRTLRAASLHNTRAQRVAFIDSVAQSVVA